MSNTVLIILSALGLAMVTLALYLKSLKERKDYIKSELMTFDRLLFLIKRDISDEIEKAAPMGATDEELEETLRRVSMIKNALKNSVDALPQAVGLVKELINTLIRKHVPDKESIQQIMDFREGYMKPEHMFETLIYMYRKEYGEDALAEVIHKYKWDTERYEIEDKRVPSYLVTIEMLQDAYSNEGFDLTYDDMVGVLSTLIFQQYKGFGIVNTLSEMNINGFNIGTSGSVMDHLKRGKSSPHKATRSVWLFFEGKFIHLRFLNFSSQEELMRIIKLMIRYKKPGPLTEKRGYIVNTMANKSRISAAIPPMAEYPVCFVRKFTLSNNTLEAWVLRPKKNIVSAVEAQEWLDAINDNSDQLGENLTVRLCGVDPEKYTPEIETALLKGINLPGYVKNANLVIDMIRYLVKGLQTTMVTGRQGSGKTTLLVTLVKYLLPSLPIRIIEMAFELYLRESYPERNIVTFQETPTVTAMECQDFTKKSDGAITIMGEIAQDAVAERWLQAARIASVCTFGTHHANTTQDLVTGLRDHIMAAGGHSDPRIAERQVLEALRFDIHLEYTPDGYRYIDRITEVVPLERESEYPKVNKKKLLESFVEIFYEHSVRDNGIKSFTTRDIIRYNKEKHAYEFVQAPTIKRCEDMYSRMQAADAAQFERFIRLHSKEA